MPFELNSRYKCWSRKRLIVFFRWNWFLVNYDKSEWRRLLAWQQFSNSQLQRHISRGPEQRSSCSPRVWGPAHWTMAWGSVLFPQPGSSLNQVLFHDWLNHWPLYISNIYSKICCSLIVPDSFYISSLISSKWRK